MKLQNTLILVSRYWPFFIYLINFSIIKGTIPIAPRAFWKENQHKFPALASLARDILCIPATGAGVERLFNSARDICHYRRGSLNSTTIQDLMMFMCTTKFNIEEQQLAFIKQYLTKEEREEIEEDQNAQLPEENVIDPISDNEEDQLLPLDVGIHNQNAPQSRDQGSSPTEQDREDGKEVTDESEGNNDDSLPLPPAQESNRRRRMSSRVRIPSKRLKGYIGS